MNLGRAFIIVFLVAFLYPLGPLFAQTKDSVKEATDTSLHIADSNLQRLVSARDSIQNDSLSKSEAKVPVQRRSGAYVIKGKVRDKNTGEGIPFATVFFPHSPLGTAADIDGNFIIKTNSLPNDTFRAQAIGYDNGNRILNKKLRDFNFIIELERSSSQLNEVVIHAGEDPALVLLKNIIKRKPVNNPDRTQNYSYLAHNKLEVDMARMSKEEFEKIPWLKNYSFIFKNLDTTSEDRPFLPLYMTESLSDYYFQRNPRKQREFIKARLMKGIQNESITQFMGTAYQNINTYDNFIPVFDKRFVSPISNEGAFYYKYTIKDTEVAYNHRIILVQFSPKRQGENCFYGDFWVVDTVFALQRVTMEVPKLANINWVNRLSLYQEFAPVNDSLWFCIKDKFIVDFNPPYGKNLPGMVGRKTTLYHNIIVDDTSITNVLDDKRWKMDVIVEDSVKDKGEQWWENYRPDSLSKNEKAIYKMVDTINNMPLTKHYENVIKFLINGTKDVGPIQLGPVYDIYSTNSIEGNRFRISLGTPEKLKDLHFTGYLAYGDKDNMFKYGFTGLWLLRKAFPRTYVYGAYTYDIDHSSNYFDKVGNDNIFAYLFRKSGIPWKLIFKNESLLEFYKEYPSGFSHKLTFDHRELTPYSPLPGPEIFVDKNGLPSNTVVNTEGALSLRYAYKEKFYEGKYLRVSLGSKYPIVQLQFASGLKDIWNSAYNYQRLNFSVSDWAPLPHLGTIRYTVFGGKYFGTLPYPLLEIVPGNEYHFYNAHAFEMMNKYEFIADQYAGFLFEHNIGSGIFRYIPLLKKAKLRQLWTAKGIIGSLSNDNKELNFTQNTYQFRSLEGNPYVELGTGVANILEMFRVDFVWRVTPKLTAQESKSSYFGVFIGFQLGF